MAAKANVRHARILDIVARDSSASVQALAAELGVSVMTIRRDLAALAQAGRLSRTHGGAVLSQAGMVEFSFKHREDRMAAEKRAIARVVAELVRPGMTLLLDTGTTTLGVARAIAAIENLTVLTTSLAIASELYPHENVQLLLLGGEVRRGSPDLSGPLTVDNLERFRADLAVLGADGARPEGVFTNDMNVARISAGMIQAAEESVLAMDSSKFQSTGLVKYADWREFNQVVTDSGVPTVVRQWLAETPTQVVYVPATAGPPRRRYSRRAAKNSKGQR